MDKIEIFYYVVFFCCLVIFWTAFALWLLYPNEIIWPVVAVLAGILPATGFLFTKRK